MAGYWSAMTYMEMRVRSRITIEKWRRAGRVVSPEVPAGETIASSWWARAWARRLELYPDESRRMKWGKRILEAGGVVDFKVDLGKITACVQGTAREPYCVCCTVPVMEIEEKRRIFQFIGERCGKRFNLAIGSKLFPMDPIYQFLIRESGFFPERDDLHMTCTCPDREFDRNHICKHRAALLYAMTSRLERDPNALLRFRGWYLESLDGLALRLSLLDLLHREAFRKEMYVDEPNVYDEKGLDFLSTEKDLGDIWNKEIPDAPHKKQEYRSKYRRGYSGYSGYSGYGRSAEPSEPSYMGKGYGWINDGGGGWGGGDCGGGGDSSGW